MSAVFSSFQGILILLIQVLDRTVGLELNDESTGQTVEINKGVNIYFLCISPFLRGGSRHFSDRNIRGKLVAVSRSHDYFAGIDINGLRNMFSCSS